MKKFNVVVKREFLDRDTGIMRKPGDKMTITEDRYLEIRRSGKSYVDIVKDAAKGAAPKVENAEIKK